MCILLNDCWPLFMGCYWYYVHSCMISPYLCILLADIWALAACCDVCMLHLPASAGSAGENGSELGKNSQLFKQHSYAERGRKLKKKRKWEEKKKNPLTATSDSPYPSKTASTLKPTREGGCAEERKSSWELLLYSTVWSWAKTSKAMWHHQTWDRICPKGVCVWKVEFYPKLPLTLFPVCVSRRVHCLAQVLTDCLSLSGMAGTQTS